MIFHFRGTQREDIYMGCCLYLSDTFHCSTDHCYFTVSQLVYWILVFHGVNVVCISIIILGVLSHIGIIRAPDNFQVQRVITPYF
jgi:hypothetical protein